MAWKVCRILALSLAVMFVVAGTLNVVQAADMSAKMTAAESGMPMPDGCNGCNGDDEGMTSTGCFALCGGMLAVLPTLPLVMAGTLIPSPTRHTAGVAGLLGPPDPYPPKPVILS